MIVRDDLQIVVQHNASERPNYIYKDGGDSCARTGPLALGSELDRKNLVLFVVNVGDHKELVRHPTQNIKAEGMKYAFNDPRSTSRDNVIQWAAGVTKDSPQECRDVCLYYAKKGWVNKDFLDFACRLYLYEKAGAKAPLCIRVLGKINLGASLVWNTKIKPNDEVNQFTLMCIHFGRNWSRRLLTWHPDIGKGLRLYWDGWRNQPEIGAAISYSLFARAV
jgi:hypothetical protein